MKTKFQFVKNILFFTVLFIGLIYFVFSFHLIQLTAESCIMALMNYSYRANGNIIFQELLKLPEFYVFIVLIVLDLFFILRFVRAVKISLRKIAGTKKYIDSLINIKTSRFNIVLNEDDMAFTYGFLRPEIFISKNLIDELDSGELEIVINHERSHVISFDPLRKVILHFFDNLMPYFPFKNKLINNFNICSEILADESSITDSQSKMKLAKSMLRIINSKSNHNLNLNFFSFERGRIEILFGDARFNFTPYYLTMLYFPVILIGFFFVNNSINSFNKCSSYSDCLVQEQSLISESTEVPVKCNMIMSPISLSR